MHKLTVKGELIVPVRLVPYITGRDFAPDDIVKILAERDDWFRVTLKAFFRQSEQGEQCLELFPRDWDSVLTDMETLTRSLKAIEKVPGEKYEEWRIESLKKIPTGTYILKSDLDLAHHQYMEHASNFHITKKRKGDHSVNYDAFVEPKARELVYAGFEDLIPQSTPQPKPEPTDSPAQSHKNEPEEAKPLSKRELNKQQIEFRNSQLQKIAAQYKKDFPDLRKGEIAKKIAKDHSVLKLKASSIEKYIRGALD